MPPSRLDQLLGAALPSLRRDPRPDAELLARFLQERDQSAFEALLVRHTPAVRAACRGWLRSATDIDDAAQATFLVLVQRARSIRDHAALGGWLYRVASNVARRLQRQQGRLRPVPDEVPGREPAADDGLRDLLAEEIARLPEKYRLPVQLCYAAGLTTAEAAERLGWPKGTVLTRLAWARQRLQKSLARRGVGSAAFAGLVGTVAVPAVSGQWVRTTARAATAILAGESPEGTGVSGRVIALTNGVVRTMFYDRMKFIALAALVAVGLAGLGIHRLASASDGPGLKAAADDAEPRVFLGKTPPAQEKDLPRPATKADDGRPAVPGRRREAVIRLPAGTFVKEVEAAPYGSGRLTWTYEEDRILGIIEGSVMGFEVELATEAEYSLSSNGTIYGLITSVRLTHVKIPDGQEFAELKPFIGLWPAIEPLINETLMDVPFSYQFRVQGDRLIISNYRILLAGPNPLGKLGGLVAANGQGSGNNEAFAVLAAFQALGTAIEGTYTAPDAKDRPAPSRRPSFSKPAGAVNPKGWKSLERLAPPVRTAD